MPNGSGNPLTGSTDFWWDPSSCKPLQSIGTGGAFLQDVEVYNCLITFFINRDVLEDEVLPDDLCPWYTTPPDTSP
jgi:hypothetical protein